MNFLIGILSSAIAAVIVLFIPWIGVGVLHLYTLFGVVVPYLAILIFLVGMIVRVLDWGRSPVPFRIPTTAGQQWSSLPIVKHSWIENPKDTKGVIVRMALEVLCFRSLFRNIKLEYRRIENLPKIAFEWEKWLWMAAIAFHYSFLIIFLRHFRFFTNPIPGFVKVLERLDGFFQAGVLPIPGLTIPEVYVTDLLLLLAVTYLLIRRLYIPQVRYVSLPSDYFPLFLILGIGTSGVLMRYFIRVDITKVKELAFGLFKFHPHVPDGIGTIFFIHLFFVCTLIAYIPFSKICHMAGIFLSPTRNLSNNTRFKRHVNPWDNKPAWEYPGMVHTYEEYEEEFRDLMIEAGIPVEKMPEKKEEEKTKQTQE